MRASRPRAAPGRPASSPYSTHPTPRLPTPVPRAGGARKGDKGYFVEPTVFADVGDAMTISRDEIFGPVQCISKWSKMDEVGGQGLGLRV